jgi:tRNA nucleotidyltransferase (CCA-adding enzyme)
MTKLLSGEDPVRAIQLAEKSGLIEYLLPELSATIGFDQKNPHHDLDVFSHTMQVLKTMSALSNDPDMRLAALFHDSGKPDSFWQDKDAPLGGGGHFYKKILKDGTVLGADHEDVGADRVREFMERLHYPNNRIDRVEKLIKNHMFPYFSNDKGARKFLRNLGGDVKMAFDLLTLRQADASGKSTGEMSEYDTQMVARDRQLLQEVLDSGEGFTLKDLAVNGNDMIGAGLKGPQIGAALNKLLDLVVENPALNNHSDLMKIVEKGI